MAPGAHDASQPASIGIVPGGSVGVRCRQAAGYTASTNEQETDQWMADNWNKAMAAIPDPRKILDGAIATMLLIGAAFWFIGRRS